MKIICDNCRTKYSIADEKVQGKVFKIRCKKCQNIIVVRGNQGAGAEDAAPQAADDVGSPAVDSKDAPVWHLVVGREQVGPMTGAEVRERFGRGEIDTESYVWREGFADWQRLTAVPDFTDLASGAVAAPAAEFGAAQPAAWSADAAPAAEAAAWSASPVTAGPASWDAGGAPTGEQQAWSAGGGEDATARADSANLFGGNLADPGRDLFASQQGQMDAAPSEMGGFNAAPAAAPAAGGLFGATPSAEAGSLFGAPAAASSGNGGQQAFPADDQGGGGGSVQMTGARHENSVLFSLSNLQALAMGGKPAAPTVGTASSSGSGGDGSGLIDIRSMAFPSAPAGAASAAADELPDLGGYAPPIAAAPVLMPSLVEERPKWILPTVIGLGGLLVVTLVVLVVVLAFRKPEQVVVAQNPPLAGTGQATAPKTPEKPAEVKDTKDTKDTKVAEAKAEEDGKVAKAKKGGKARKGGKGGKGTAVAVAKAEPEPASGGGGSKPRKAGKGDELDALIDGAIGGGGGKKAPKKAAAPAAAAGGGGGNLPDTLSRAEIQGGMRKIKDRVQGCYDKFRVPGTAFVSVTISPSGTISNAKVKGMFAGTPTGACLQAAARSATFPRFKGAPITIDYPFILR